MDAVLTQSLTRGMEHFADGAILTRIFKILGAISTDKGPKVFIKDAVKAALAIGLTLYIHQKVTNRTGTSNESMWWNMLISRLYVRRRIMVTSSNLDFIEMLDTRIRTGRTVGVNERIITYVDRCHRSLIEDIEEECRRIREAANSPVIRTTFYRFNAMYEECVASELYPSDDFLKLENIITTYVKASAASKIYRVFGIVINGPSGLGKSSFGDYIASRNVVNRVYRIDFSAGICCNMDPDTVFSKAFFSTSISCNCVYIFDEIDKYLDRYINTSYHACYLHQPRPQNLYTQF